jgi:hypothetical protein
MIVGGALLLDRVANPAFPRAEGWKCRAAASGFTLKRSLLFAFSLTILPALHAEKIDNRNFAIDTCFPTPNAVQRAEGRTRAYWAKHASCFGAEPRFLAVETSKIFPDEVQNLWPKLINSETTASFFFSRNEE